MKLAAGNCTVIIPQSGKSTVRLHDSEQTKCVAIQRENTLDTSLSMEDFCLMPTGMARRLFDGPSHMERGTIQRSSSREFRSHSRDGDTPGWIQGRRRNSTREEHRTGRWNNSHIGNSRESEVLVNHAARPCACIGTTRQKMDRWEGLKLYVACTSPSHLHICSSTSPSHLLCSCLRSNRKWRHRHRFPNNIWSRPSFLGVSPETSSQLNMERAEAVYPLFPWF
jgi:hypothetical protein